MKKPKSIIAWAAIDIGEFLDNPEGNIMPPYWAMAIYRSRTDARNAWPKANIIKVHISPINK